MTKQEKQQELQWRAEDDARTMAQYQEILKDKARLQRAVKVADKQAKELQQRADTMKKVANKKKGDKKNDKKRN